MQKTDEIINHIRHILAQWLFLLVVRVLPDDDLGNMILDRIKIMAQECLASLKEMEESSK